MLFLVLPRFQDHKIRFDAEIICKWVINLRCRCNSFNLPITKRQCFTFTPESTVRIPLVKFKILASFIQPLIALPRKRQNTWEQRVAKRLQNSAKIIFQLLLTSICHLLTRYRYMNMTAIVDAPPMGAIKSNPFSICK